MTLSADFTARATILAGDAPCSVTMLSRLNWTSSDRLEIKLSDSGPIFLRPAQEGDEEEVEETAIVAGHVAILLTKPRRFVQIRLVLSCAIELLSRSSGTIARDTHYAELVHRIADEQGPLPAGEHSFAFSFQLPASASPSAKSRHGAVNWVLTARATGPHPLSTRLPLEICVLSPGQNLGDRGAIDQIVRGLIGELGLFEMTFAGDGHIGGRYFFTLDLPSSASGVVIRRIALHIQQFQLLDTQFASGEQENAMGLEEPLPMTFLLCELDHERVPSNVEWPKPGPQGAKFHYSGTLPGCRDTISWSRDYIQPSTPATTRTAFRIDHALILELDWAMGPTMRSRRLRYPKQIKLSTCAVANERNNLPRYTSIASTTNLNGPTRARPTQCACYWSGLQPLIEPVPSRDTWVK